MQRMADAFNEDQSAAEGKGRLAKVRMLPMLRRIFKQRALHVINTRAQSLDSRGRTSERDLLLLRPFFRAASILRARAAPL